MNSNFVAKKALGHAQLTSIDASTLLSSVTGGIPVGTTIALITPQSQAVRWRDDGTAPTATVGYPLAISSELVYTSQSMGNLRFISQVAGAAINIAFYGSTT